MHAPEDIFFRGEVVESDRETVRSIVCSTGFFSEAEIQIAVELVDERLSKGDASGYHFLFAEAGTNVLGYSCFGPIPGTLHSFDLYWIAIHQDLRGKGIGRILLSRSEKAIGSLGGIRVYVETSSRAQYEPTRIFYRNAGYRQEAFLEDFYAPGDGKIILVKEVSGSGVQVSGVKSEVRARKPETGTLNVEP